MIGKITYNQIKLTYKKLGYKFYTAPYNINLFGVRNDSLEVNKFNDILGVAYTDDFGNEICLVSEATTKPGISWLKEKKGNVNGTAVLIPDHYKSCFVIGKHRGSYEAFTQSDRALFKVWRDYDKDGELDYNGKIYSDVTGLNTHTTSFNRKTKRVGAYSAGCQVRKFTFQHLMLMLLGNESARRYGKYFSYALFEENQLIKIKPYAEEKNIFTLFYPFWRW